MAESLLTLSESDPVMSRRTAAFWAIHTERLYQDAGFGNAANRVTGIEMQSSPMSPGEHLLTLDDILREAKDAWYHPGSQVMVAHLVRKMGGVCVSFMERYGAIPRSFSDGQKAILTQMVPPNPCVNPTMGEEAKR